MCTRICFALFLFSTLSLESCVTVPPKSTHPAIVFDNGHYNYGKPESFEVMKAFLSEQGFTVTKSTSPITKKSMQGIDVFHTSNALAPENEGNWALPTPSAFTVEEISVLLDWVQNGGSLLMVIEHMPFGGSYEALASAFGIKVSNGFAVDYRLLNGYSSESIAEAGFLVFRREDGSLANHPILDREEPFGRIEFLATDAGSAFRLPEQGLSLITLDLNTLSLEPKVSWEFDSETVRISTAGWSQAGILGVGQGWVALLGDNFLISAPAFLKPPYVESEREAEFGAFNHQFTLNLYRWLSGLLEE